MRRKQKRERESIKWVWGEGYTGKSTTPAAATSLAKLFPLQAWRCLMLFPWNIIYFCSWARVGESWAVVMEIACLAQLKIFTLWPFTEKGSIES